MEAMSDAELNDIIFAEENEVDSGVSNDDSVSPVIEDSEEQPDVIDDGQDTEDLEDDTTDEDQTDDSEQETSEEDDTEADEDKGTDAGNKTSDEGTQFQALKANGKEYPIDSIDELYKLASAGVGAQQKFQAIAGSKKAIMAAQKAEVDLMEAVNFMANYKDNPQELVARLLKDNGIDPLDIDTEAEVKQAKDHSVSDFEVKYDEVVSEIGDSPIFPKVQDLLVKGWDERSRQVFLDEPEMIKNLHDEMSPSDELDGKSMFDLVSPIAEKMKLSGDMRSDFDVYMDARAKKVEEISKYENIKETTQPKAKPSNKGKKKASSPTNGKSAGVPTLDFATMSDAELDAFLDKA